MPGTIASLFVVCLLLVYLLIINYLLLVCLLSFINVRCYIIYNLYIIISFLYAIGPLPYAHSIHKRRFDSADKRPRPWPMGMYIQVTAPAPWWLCCVLVIEGQMLSKTLNTAHSFSFRQKEERS